MAVRHSGPVTLINTRTPAPHTLSVQGRRCLPTSSGVSNMPRSGGIQYGDLLRRQLQIHRGVRVAVGLRTARAWDWDDDRGLRQHPREGELLRADAELGREGLEGRVLRAELARAADAAERGPRQERD